MFMKRYSNPFNKIFPLIFCIFTYQKPKIDVSNKQIRTRFPSCHPTSWTSGILRSPSSGAVVEPGAGGVSVQVWAGQFTSDPRFVPSSNPLPASL